MCFTVILNSYLAYQISSAANLMLFSEDQEVTPITGLTSFSTTFHCSTIFKPQRFKISLFMQRWGYGRNKPVIMFVYYTVLKGEGLRPLACCDCGIGSRRGAGSFSLVSVACCRVEVCASGSSLVQRSPTKCGVSDCNSKVSIMRRPWPTGGLSRHGKEKYAAQQ
jgi:hypothetical protein